MQDLQLPQIVSDILAGDPAKYELIKRKYQRAIFNTAVTCWAITRRPRIAANLRQYKRDMLFEAWLDP